MNEDIKFPSKKENILGSGKLELLKVLRVIEGLMFEL